MSEFRHICGCYKFRKMAVFFPPKWFVGPNYIEMMQNEKVDEFYDQKTKVSHSVHIHEDWIEKQVVNWNHIQHEQYVALDKDQVVIQWVVWLKHHQRYHPELPRHFVIPEEVWESHEVSGSLVDFFSKDNEQVVDRLSVIGSLSK